MAKKTFIALEGFSGYPEGDHEGSSRVDYEKGVEYTENEKFADLVVGKKHARWPKAETVAEEKVGTAPAGPTGKPSSAK